MSKNEACFCGTALIVTCDTLKPKLGGEGSMERDRCKQ